MSSSIGTIATDIIHGLPQDTKMRVDVWEVPGINGYGAQQLGLADAEFALKSVKYILSTDAVDPDTYVDNCNAAEGSIQTVTDDWGDPYPNILIKHVVCQKSPCIYKGDAQAVRVEVDWSMVTMQ